MHKYALWSLALLLLHSYNGAIVAAYGEGCNELVCGSVVSKCLLTQSCQCKLSDCSCCKDCFNCLGDLYTECCSCVDMCPKHNETLSALSPKSQIGDFDGVPELFETLTAEDDDEQWTVVRMPKHAGLKHLAGSFGVDIDGDASVTIGDAIDRQAAIQKLPSSSINCTVIYLHVCKSNKKCAYYCESMGANSYRWFHDGCCECVGAHCFNYGINESRCASCPEAEEYVGAESNDEDDESMWDYGEDDISYN
ncbi:protein twisted gastrulation-like [Teleopsis dalmanni]|uniref:protein twisted gastrulation-like n=1 Tax=Teleopsis dalmanni TaxID=139649 RepID=UPI0018CF0D5F|nr:protein twisted gastrulation-like [Teleopsis dalmanni]